MKQINVFNYQIASIPKVLNGLKLQKDQRVLRKKLYQIIQKSEEMFVEEMKGLQEEHADVDEKGEKKVKFKVGENVQYEYSQENAEKLQAEANKLHERLVKIDILPADEEYLPKIADWLENIDVPLNRQEELLIEGICKALLGQPVEEDNKNEDEK